MQPVAEAHFVTHVGKNEAPADWGCDALWQGGAAVYERCVAVFAIGYTLDEASAPPPYLNDLLASAPIVAGEQTAYPESVLDLNRMFPADKSYYTYVGSLVRFLRTLSCMELDSTCSGCTQRLEQF